MIEIDVHQLKQDMDAGHEVIDVREPDEYAEAHVPGVRLIPMGQVESRLDEIDDSEPVRLICRSGNRSGVIGEMLESRGYQAINVAGGTNGWIEAGYPVDAGE